MSIIFKFKQSWAKFLLFLFLGCGLFLAIQALWAWNPPGLNPPNGNVEEPLNKGAVGQGKSGLLTLGADDAPTNAEALIIRPGKLLMFGYPGALGSSVGFKAPAVLPASDLYWELPNTAGNLNDVLSVVAVGRLGWTTPSGGGGGGIDNDWRYDPDSSSFTSIYSEVLTRVGNGGIRNLATGAGDLYVQDALEVDGMSILTGRTKVGAGGAVNYAVYGGDLYVQNMLEVDDTAYLSAINSNTIKPNVDLTYDLGSLALRWNNIYGNNINSGTILSLANNTYNLGSTGNIWKNIYGNNIYANFLNSKNIYLPNTKEDKTEGVIFFGQDGVGNWEPFMHNAGDAPYYTNTYVGKQTGSFSSNSNNFFNSALGYYALHNNNSGDRNVALGYNALNLNEAGGSNTAIGSESLASNISGALNTAIGLNALFSNLGSDNTAVGSEALLQNSVGIANVAIGSRALYSSNSAFNVALGNDAGHDTSTGTNNIFIGDKAGLKNITGQANVALGNTAGQNNTEGSRNIFIGYEAGKAAVGSNQLYIHNNNMGENFALIYGKMSGADTVGSQFLRVNGALEMGLEGASAQIRWQVPLSLIGYSLTMPPAQANRDGLALINDGNGTLRWDTPHDDDWKLDADLDIMYTAALSDSGYEWGPWETVDGKPGKVGIGTNNPQGLFHVRGTSRSQVRNIILEADSSTIGSGGTIFLNPGLDAMAKNPGEPQGGVAINMRGANPAARFTLDVEGSLQAMSYWSYTDEQKGRSGDFCIGPILNPTGEMFFRDGLFICYRNSTCNCTMQQCVDNDPGC